LKLDLHTHTFYSYDCLLSLRSLQAAVRQRGLDGIAVLDHDEIEGAKRLRDSAAFEVIVGEEIGTCDGGIAGLFLKERIPPHLTAEETIERIHHQGGLVLVPHPLSRGVPGRINPQKLRQVLGQVDIIEGYNSRAPLAADDGAARRMAAKSGIAVSAGSDAHWACEVGRAWTKVDPARSPGAFLGNLQTGRLHYTTKTSYLVAALTIAVIAPRTLARWARGPGKPAS
jgi:hypothetical protein